MRCVKNWLDTTDEAYGIFIEDDTSFETCKYWSFTWSEFVRSLPENWEIVQLIRLNDWSDGRSAELSLRPRQWDDWGATFTTSPKLSNNGDPIEKRYKPEVLKWHAFSRSGFKFVVSSEKEVDEILEKYVKACNVPKDRIWLMPCCGSRVEHSEKAHTVAELCKKYNFNFSPRLQLVIWDKALKV
jgi:hypothetical protein